MERGRPRGADAGREEDADRDAAEEEEERAA